MTASISSQPIERWGFALIGALQGALIWLTGETLDDRPGGWLDALLVGTLMFLAVAPPLYFTLRYNADRRASAMWALGLGAVYFLLFTVFFQRFGEDTLALPSGIGLPLAILASGAIRGTFLNKEEPFNTRLLLSCWSSALSLAVALIAGGIVLGLIAASAALVRFAGLHGVSELMTDVYVMSAAFGGSVAFLFALIAERDSLMDGVVQVIILAGRYLFVLVLALIALVLIAMVVGSVTDLSRQVSVAGLCLGLTGAALLLGLSGQIQPPAMAPGLTKILRYGWALALPLVGIATYATAIRIGQYGLTPQRIFLVALCVLAALLVLGLLLDALRQDQGWRDKTLKAFVGATAAFMALSITPWLSWPDMANGSQAARLAHGEEGLNEDAAHYLWHYGGKAGQALLAKFEGSVTEDALRERIAAIRKSSRYRAYDDPSMTPLDQAEFFASLPVKPAGTALPEDFASNNWAVDDMMAYDYLLRQCQEDEDANCQLFIGDVLPMAEGDEVMLYGDKLYQIAVFARDEEGGIWSYAGAMYQRGEASDENAKEGDFAIVPPNRNDVLLEGRRFIFE